MDERQEALHDLLKGEATRIAARYKVTREEALEALYQAFADRPELLHRLHERMQQEDVTRWRDYRDAVKECRKSIYYSLRRYYTDPEEADRLIAEFEREVAGDRGAERIAELRGELLSAHTATRERMDYYQEFYDAFFALVGRPGAILDIGCGMHPLSYPFAGVGRCTQLYVAADRDPRILRCLHAYARLVGAGLLQPAATDLREPDWAAALPVLGPFELATLLKVVPVLERLDRSAAMRLAEVPAERIFLTGSTESMTRRQDIEARQRAVLDRFIGASGRTVLEEFRAGQEFGYLVE